MQHEVEADFDGSISAYSPQGIISKRLWGERAGVISTPQDRRRGLYS